MKRNSFGHRATKILAVIGCLLLAVLVWLVVRYSQIGGLPITMPPLG